jgi:hypothetical protein
MIPILLTLAVLCSWMTAPAMADKPGTDKAAVVSVWATPQTTPGLEKPIDGSTANKLEKAGGAAVTNCISMMVGASEQHSIFYAATSANNAGTLLITLQSLTPAGTWVGFNPAVTLSLTGATSYSGRAALSLPVCDTVRFVVSADATHASTWTSLGLSKW